MAPTSTSLDRALFIVSGNCVPLISFWLSFVCVNRIIFCTVQNAVQDVEQVSGNTIVIVNLSIAVYVWLLVTFIEEKIK